MTDSLVFSFEEIKKMAIRCYIGPTESVDEYDIDIKRFKSGNGYVLLRKKNEQLPT